MNQVRTYMSKLSYVWALRQQIAVIPSPEDRETSESYKLLLLDSKMASKYSRIISIKNDEEVGGRSTGQFEILENSIRFSGTIDGSGADKSYTPPFVSLVVDVGLLVPLVHFGREV